MISFSSPFLNKIQIEIRVNKLSHFIPFNGVHNFVSKKHIGNTLDNVLDNGCIYDFHWTFQCVQKITSMKRIYYLDLRKGWNWPVFILIVWNNSFSWYVRTKLTSATCDSKKRWEFHIHWKYQFRFDKMLICAEFTTHCTHKQLSPILISMIQMFR